MSSSKPFKNYQKELKAAIKNAKKNYERKLAKDAKNLKAFWSNMKKKTSNRVSVVPLKEDNKLVTDIKEQANIVNRCVYEGGHHQCTRTSGCDGVGSVKLSLFYQLKFSISFNLFEKNYLSVLAV